MIIITREGVKRNLNGIIINERKKVIIERYNSKFKGVNLPMSVIGISAIAYSRQFIF